MGASSAFQAGCCAWANARGKEIPHSASHVVAKARLLSKTPAPRLAIFERREQSIDRKQHQWVQRDAAQPLRWLVEPKRLPRVRDCRAAEHAPHGCACAW